MKRKDLIIAEGIRYFNRQGFGAGSLHQLAHEMGMSRGNLSYHFKTKELLLKAIVEQMWERMELTRNRSKAFPSFKNLQEEIKVFQKIQKDYSFIFTDAQVLMIPEIKKQLLSWRKSTIDSYLSTIAFSIRMGNMHPEKIPGTYENLCRSLWMITFYWISQQSFLDHKKETNWDKIMWSLLLPHFTAKGLKAFQSYFGRAYYDSLAEPFDLGRFEPEQL